MLRQGHGFALVLAIWGSRYGAVHVNALVEAACSVSPNLSRIVLLTDHRRGGIDDRVQQKLFPPPFDRTEFFSHGYRAKLAVFAAVPAEDDMPCVFVDLDSVVLGDLGRIAELVRTPDDLLMLPPAGLKFSRLRRALDRIRNDPRKFPVGNSSVVAFHSAARPNLAETYANLHRSGRFPEGWSSVIDDVLISSFGRGRIRAIPADLAVMLRREFLSRLPFWPSLRTRLPWIRKRRARIAVVTMNGLAVKAEVLASLPERAVIGDGRGRRGIWSESGFGTLFVPLRAASKRIATAPSCQENDLSCR